MVSFSCLHPRQSNDSHMPSYLCCCCYFYDSHNARRHWLLELCRYMCAGCSADHSCDFTRDALQRCIHSVIRLFTTHRFKWAQCSFNNCPIKKPFNEFWPLTVPCTLLVMMFYCKKATTKESHLLAMCGCNTTESNWPFLVSSSTLPKN